MYKSPVKRILTQHVEVKDWATALEDATAQLSKARERVQELESAVRVCRKNSETGKPWPGASATHN